MRVMSIDPGVTSGYAFATINVENGMLGFYPYQVVDDVDECFERIAAYQPEHLICEGFEFRQRARVGLELFSVQLIGVARLYTLKAAPPKYKKCVFHNQTAYTGKSYYSDKILKQMGAYVKGVPHAVDATRQLLHWFTFGAGNQFNKSKTRQNWAVLLDKAPQ